MANPDLSNYYGNLVPNENLRLQAKIVGYVTVGNGSFSTLTPSQLAFEGNYSVLGHQGTVCITLTVTGDNVGTFTFNELSGSCTFQEHGDGLYIYFTEGGGQTSLEAESWDSGLWLGGQATPYNIWIGV